MEQILASHSAVEGTQELADIPRIAADLKGRDRRQPRYPAVLAGMGADDFQRLGEKYLADTRIYRTGKARFIDKMPNNFRHIGLIHLMLPNAKIIDARREPMACCFGNLKQLFAQGQEFTYSSEDIARYYRTYLELMRHWDAVLPGRVLRVQHEDVVDDLEGSVRRILDFCELDFEPGCVEFHKTSRSIRTASSEQVRQPIYREGLDQWRNYEPGSGAAGGARRCRHALPIDLALAIARRCGSDLQQDGRVGGPADVDLVAPVDRPFRGAALVLREDGDELAGGRLDLVSRSVAQVAQLPHHALELIDAPVGVRLFAQPDLLRTQRHPDPLARV